MTILVMHLLVKSRTVTDDGIRYDRRVNRCRRPRRGRRRNRFAGKLELSLSISVHLCLSLSLFRFYLIARLRDFGSDARGAEPRDKWFSRLTGVAEAVES